MSNIHVAIANGSQRAFAIYVDVRTDPEIGWSFTQLRGT